MNKRKSVNSTSQSTSTGSVDKKLKRAYVAPSVRSAEPLEAVAVVCSPDTNGGPGKNVAPFGCAALGS
jgi:hypothetical protein